ncbi:MAG TPA: S9 family peptidase [Gaiellaceae bacterium]|nr:S9 family peptidase [Gaiellaceae bacterium]
MSLPRSLRELLELRQAWPLSWSSDGSTLLVASDLPGTHQLFMLPAAGGELVQATDYDEPVLGQLLPDGRILLELDEGGNERTQLYVLEPGGAAEPLVVDPRFNHWTPRVSHDGSLLAYATNRGNGRDFEVVARRLGSGDEQCFDLRGYLGVHAVSPDGRRILVERLSDLPGDSDLFVLDAETGDVADVTPAGEGEFMSLSWLPDSSGFFAATNAFGEHFALARHDLAAGEWRTVHDAGWDLECVLDDAGRNLLLALNEDGWSRLELRDPQTLELRAEVPLPARGVASDFVFSPGGSRLAFAFSSPREPRQIHVHDVGTGELRRLTGEGPIAGVDPGLHRFASFDRESIPVFLFEPEGDGPFPVVVTVHGGPESQWRPWYSQGFGPLTQYLVSRGYAVAAPNVRGSSGYGKRFEHLDDVALRLDSVRDLAELHAWLSARPEIDGSRVVVYGRSYGGYMVLAALAFQPELWAAGIDFVGISSFVTFLGNTSEYRRAAREREYGSLATDREVLERISPAGRVDAIRAPLFVEHGRNDPRVPVGESEHIHRVLTENGVRCELVIYEDEGHTIEKLENRIDAFERAVAFLDEVLG